MPALSTLRERSFRFSMAILGEYRKLLAESDVPRHPATQLLRSATAIGANLEEAKSAYSRRELIAKNSIALREARECTYWLRLIQADQPHRAASLSPLITECEELASMLTVANRRLRGA